MAEELTPNEEAAGEAVEAEVVAPDLTMLNNDELVELEATLVSEYETASTTEAFAAGDLGEATDIVEAIEIVQSEMVRRASVSALDARAFSTMGAEFSAAVAEAEVTPEEVAELEALLVEEEAPAEVVAEVPEVVVPEVSSDAAVSSDDIEVVTDPAQAKETVALSDETTEISPDGLAGDKPVVVEAPIALRASADVPGYAAGQALPDLKAVAKAFMAKRPSVRGTDVSNDGYRYLVASVEADYPEDRILGNDVTANMYKVEAVTSPAAIVASGGFCAPLTPYYKLQLFGDTDRPVRDSLPMFKADRGGIRFSASPKLSNLAGSSRRTTAVQDAAGYTNQTPAGTTAPKPCLHITCPAESTAVVEAVSRCLTFGNLAARTHPENVEQWLSLSMIEFSRYAEVELLDMISASSTAVTAAQWGGATASLLEQVTLAVTAFKARNRVRKGIVMKAMLPFWAKELIKTDLSHQPPYEGVDQYGVTDAMIASWFAARGISITWYQDNTTAAGVPFAVQGAGALIDWPDTIVWFLFPEGAFLYLDGGSLDLGLVRDSTLNSANDYQIWAEEFFSIVYLGTEAYKVTSTVAPNGNYGGKLDGTVKPGSYVGAV